MTSSQTGVVPSFVGRAALHIALGLLSASVGCESSDAPGSAVEGGAANGFLSYVPGEGDGSGGAASAESSGAASTGGTASDQGVDAAQDDSAARSIAEADIIQIDGDRLYALSRYAGLSVIDVSKPKRLTLLGRYRTSAEPFEMYLRDGIAYVMFNGYQTSVYDEENDEYRWESTARMQALDVRDPAKIGLLADHEVPGDISDSRWVGDILYLVTYQSGWCWRCQGGASTQVTSFDVSQRDRFERVDELRFTHSSESWGPRSVSATDQRLYIAGEVWNQVGGEIDVVDISDSSGALAKGATIEIAGHIQSRWQMEEIDGVLHVISQRNGWDTDAPPVLETFEVGGAGSFAKLAGLEMKLPRPESLRSVRFDGDRAYAVTFERTDPLFTFDLSDPSEPKQLGELEIPGWLHHMEPRGDLLYALGFEPDQEGGQSLHVSLFDVSDLENPSMISRVHFGGDWGGFAEDQDRIHKAFNILEDEGLIMVPFSGSSWGDDDECSRYSYQSGIQLIDITSSGLRKQGVAPQRGEARRALLHEGNLFGITDESVQVFDISDRAAPAGIGQLEVARNVNAVRIRGDQMVRFGVDWWTNETILDYVDLDRVDQVEGDGSLDLSKVIEDDNACYIESYWDGRMFVHGQYAYLPRRTYVESPKGGDWVWQEELTFVVVDLEADGGPKATGSFSVEPARNDEGGIDNMLLTDSALLVGRNSGRGHYDEESRVWVDREYAYDIFDLGDGKKPKFTKRFTLPSKIASGGWGHASVGCGMGDGWGYWYRGYGSGAALVSGDIVVSQHLEPVDDGTGRVRYYLDRLDVSDPAHPELLEEVNIPGNVVFYDHPSKRLVSIDYDRVTETVLNREECWSLGYQEVYPKGGTECEVYKRRVNSLVLEDDRARLVSTVEIEKKQPALSVGVGAERLFFTTMKNGWNAPEGAKVKAHALRFEKGGELEELPTVELEGQGWGWGWSDLQVIGARAFMQVDNELQVLDASGDGKPVLRRHETPGWWCSSLEVKDDHAYCAMDKHGVLDIEL